MAYQHTFLTVKALSTTPSPIDVKLRVPVREASIRSTCSGGWYLLPGCSHLCLQRVEFTDVFSKISGSFSAIAEGVNDCYPPFVKVFDSTQQWKEALRDGESIRSALNGRQLIVIRGSKDDGVVREAWEWDMASFQRLIPGVQRVQVQGM